MAARPIQIPSREVRNHQSVRLNEGRLKLPYQLEKSRIPESWNEGRYTFIPSLDLPGCSGWSSFIAKVVEMKVILKLKRLETLDTQWAITTRASQQAIAHFIGSFTGLENLYLYFDGSWDPDSTFWIGMAGHHTTLRRSILDGLWKDRLQRSTILQTRFHQFASNPSSNPIGLLNTECLGLINEPTHLVRIGVFLGDFRWWWAWEEVGKSEYTRDRWGLEKDFDSSQVSVPSSSGLLVPKAYPHFESLQWATSQLDAANPKAASGYIALEKGASLSSTGETRDGLRP
ncbi:hypothetical protein B0J13DRAFT_534210 [Dactylonectria estremocensis]|uniref:Uncharacterized protein n=1 Tax=Dactylonectria estremocensis TaxID=1079267 RepID=A0A9P9D3B7_9HYPO|nr:hypothetical protein B0J13DRAFT_534210 [Dactylonectria estremocensis]